ncbi:MAG: bile acid:sodium symporter family protein [Saprospiraceae bacterium]|nr:bile acid:sodium symporter family protein [Saprospiraceae bacterium]
MEAFMAMVPQLLQLLLFLIMFGMGMTLTIDDFRRVGQFPKAVFIGLCNQVLLLPLVGLLIISVLPMDPVVAMGLMIVTACPGGATSNLISHLSKGDTALSISLTAISSLITVFTIPFIINYSLLHIMGESGKAIQLPVMTTIINIIKLTALPVALGMFINYRFPVFSQKSRKALAWGSGIFILIALALIVLKLAELGNVWDFIMAAGLGVICLNILTFGVGFISSRVLRLNTPQSITISIESGMQNNVLGMAIATAPTMLNNPAMATSAGVYGIIMCTLGLGLIYLFRQLPSE